MKFDETFKILLVGVLLLSAIGVTVASAEELVSVTKTDANIQRVESISGSGIPQLMETEDQRDARIQWFRDAKFGLFIHWGPAAISGKEIYQLTER